VYRLISAVRQRVEDTFGVVLRCENRLVGFDDVEHSELEVEAG
jgi:UDP-N-acetylenolpyruvoylglucosamine reductase